MNTMNPVKRTVLAALFAAMCVVLPIAFHSIPNAGSVFLPMHIPVLLCGMICGWPYGLVCGIIGPFLCTMITGMPPAAMLPAMMVECAAYGAVAGIMLKLVRTGKTGADLYIALIVAMLAGRVLAGIAKALIFSPGITLSAWITASFVTALPGILVQLVAIPILVSALTKAHMIPSRYPAE